VAAPTDSRVRPGSQRGPRVAMTRLGVLQRRSSHSPPAVVTPSPALAAPEPAAQPANNRELLPGKTVTLIPASTGPSSGTDEADAASPEEGREKERGGGKCRGGGRGPGIGIAAAPRPDFRVSY
jgi:hypothetical protein